MNGSFRDRLQCAVDAGVISAKEHNVICMALGFLYSTQNIEEYSPGYERARDAMLKMTGTDVNNELPGMMGMTFDELVDDAKKRYPGLLP